MHTALLWGQLSLSSSAAQLAPKSTTFDGVVVPAEEYVGLYPAAALIQVRGVKLGHWILSAISYT
jgi:hypothetical protein